MDEKRLGIGKCFLCTDEDKLNPTWCNRKCALRDTLIKKNRKQKILNKISKTLTYLT